MVDRSTAPLEMFGEPDDTECPHGIPTGMGVECWECRYDQLKNDYDDLEQECDDLTERVRELAAEIAEHTIKELDILYRIRKAIGDNGKMMQDELVDHIEGLVRRVKELEEIVELKDAAYQIAKSAGEELLKKVQGLEKDNALLRKRLEAMELKEVLTAYENPTKSKEIG